VNSTFPEVAAGDSNRAAFMFLGTTTAGNYKDPTTFKGIWHAYIATTLDGGQSYAVVDGTPDDPVQVGSICNLGTTGCQMNAVSGADRNMLDFMDLTVDAQGRVVGAFADGCVVGTCDANSPPSASRSALGTVIRQSGGPRLFAAFDPVEPTVPGAPQLVSAVAQAGGGVIVQWLVPDNGGSPITAYNIYRGTASGAETLLQSIGPGKTTFFDATAVSNVTYYYKVSATNSQGNSAVCGEKASGP